MSAFHTYYYRHLVAIHDNLRRELRSVRKTLPTVTQPIAIRTVCMHVLQFCDHLEGHHDLEEAVIFPSFKLVTDISHWDHSHKSLFSTLDRCRALAKEGIKTVNSSNKNIVGEDSPQALFEKNLKQPLMEQLENLSDIVLPHLTDEEVLSHPDETTKFWPTERDMRRAFPWMR
ncbi:hypothetical protein DFQ26_003283 [Actinomortierella ambigua]|nr:hypothetical protein DFQ26_003283 [Actinomortierella ambigua]